MTNELKVGKLITQPEERDAIHIAIAPVRAAIEIKPGTHVGFVGDSSEIVSPHAIRLVGIIDPFLTKSVKPNEVCFLFVYPNQITSLNHHWKHPAFDKDAPSALVPFVPTGLETPK
jgi:hypothetical protein